MLRSELRDRREDLFGLCCGVQRDEKVDARQLTGAIMCVKRLQEQGVILCRKSQIVVRQPDVLEDIRGGRE